jgi:hypothetical protein
MRRFLEILLAIATLVSVLMVAVPAYLIRPFVAQSARGVEVSYLLRSWSPTVTLLLLLVAALPLIMLWRAAVSWTGRTTLSLAGVLLVASAFMARQNYFEWVFKRAPAANYVEATNASHVADGDMVIAIEHQNQARAYPVRIIAFHHLLNEVVAGEPIVVTY